MVIKRYIVSNMNEAMTRIRYELGKDAVIISQRKIRKPGIAGLFSKKVIEVTAAVENMSKGENESIKSSLEAFKRVMEKEDDRTNKDFLVNTQRQNYDRIESEEQNLGFDSSNISEVIKKASETFNQKDAPPLETKKANDVAPDSLLKEVHEMKDMIKNIVNTTSSINDKSEIEILLEKNDVDKEIIDKVLDKLKNSSSDKDEYLNLKTIMEEMLVVDTPKMEGNVVLVGPTGVGKTTTIAKLAGRLALIEKKKVGLITVDTYRIGAVEQLKTYADIMNIPFKVVFSTKDMESAIESLKDCDVILVDTTGRSSKNTMQISELRLFIEKTNTTNIHLVISASTKNKDISAIIEGYKILGYNNIIITKLDETSTYGSILNILEKGRKPLSFVTTGQNVPDDIKNISVEEVTKLVLGEDSIC